MRPLAILSLALPLALAGCRDRPARTGESLEWTTVRDVEHLKSEMASARAAGKPVVVEVWAAWCVYCHKYDDVFRANPALKRRFESAARLRIDVTDDPHQDLRAVVGIGPEQPLIVFFDPKGNRVPGADLVGFVPRDTAGALRRSLDLAD